MGVAFADNVRPVDIVRAAMLIPILQGLAAIESVEASSWRPPSVHSPRRSILSRASKCHLSGLAGGALSTVPRYSISPNFTCPRFSASTLTNPSTWRPK